MKLLFFAELFDGGFPFEEKDFGYWVVEIFSWLLAALLLYLLFLIVEWCFPDKIEYSSGIIIDELHKPESTHHGTGVGISGGGQPVVVSTTTHSPERWEFVIKEDNTGDILKVETDMKQVYTLNPGDRINFHTRWTAFTKSFKGNFHDPK